MRVVGKKGGGDWRVEDMELGVAGTEFWGFRVLEFWVFMFRVLEFWILGFGIWDLEFLGFRGFGGVWVF